MLELLTVVGTILGAVYLLLGLKLFVKEGTLAKGKLYALTQLAVCIVLGGAVQILLHCFPEQEDEIEKGIK